VSSIGVDYSLSPYVDSGAGIMFAARHAVA
jgi:hypothetical protein